MNENKNVTVEAIQINPELKDLIFPLSPEEYELLEKSIIDEGCRDALILWGSTIVDGHNRYEICTKHNIEFKTVQKDFEDIEYAKEWIILNQFSRRNLNPYQRGILVLKVEGIISARLAGPQISADQKKVVKDKETGELKLVKKDTRDVLAELSGMSHDSIDKIKKIQNSDNEEVISLAKSNSIKINQAVLLIDKDIDEKNKKKIKEAYKLIENESDDKTKENLKLGKKYINEVVKEIKSEKKSKKLEEKKAEFIEQSKADIFNLPEVCLMDCNDFMNTFDDDSIDLLFTDPPYMTDIPEGKIGEFTENWLPLAIQKTKKSGRMLIFAGAYPMEIQAFLNVLLSQDKFIVDCPLIWTFENTLGVTPKMKYNLNYQFVWHLYSKDSPELDISITNEMFSVMEENAPDGRQGNRLHTWQKPDDLALRLIRHTTKANDLIVDPFVCTGTFVLAANRLLRNGKGCDNSQENLNIAISRGCILINKKDE